MKQKAASHLGFDIFSNVTTVTRQASFDPRARSFGAFETKKVAQITCTHPAFRGDVIEVSPKHADDGVAQMRQLIQEEQDKIWAHA